MTTVLLHSGAAAPKLETPRPQVKVVRGGNRGLNRARRFAQATLRTLALAIVLGLVVSVLYSHAKLTELSGQINEVNTQLAAAQSEYDYLSTKMSDITSRASLQEVAEEHNRKKQQFRRPPAGQGPHRRPEPAGWIESVTIKLCSYEPFCCAARWPTAKRLFEIRNTLCHNQTTNQKSTAPAPTQR